MIKIAFHLNGRVYDSSNITSEIKDQVIALSIIRYSEYLQEFIMDTIKEPKKQKTILIKLFINENNYDYSTRIFAPKDVLEKISEKEFDVNKGIIGKTFKTGHCQDTSIPSHPDEYKTYLIDNYSYNEEDLEKINMKSTFLSAYRIEEGTTPYGVILFESLDNTGYNKITKINEKLKKLRDDLIPFVKLFEKNDFTKNLEKITLSERK